MTQPQPITMEVDDYLMLLIREQWQQESSPLAALSYTTTQSPTGLQHHFIEVTTIEQLVAIAALNRDDGVILSVGNRWDKTNHTVYLSPLERGV